MVKWLRKLFDKLQVHSGGDILLQNLRYAFRTLRPGSDFCPRRGSDSCSGHVSRAAQAGH